MHTYEAVEVWLHAFLIWALDGGEWLASRPGRFIPVARTPGPRARLDVVANIKILSRPESNPGRPAQESINQYLILLWDASYHSSPVDCPRFIALWVAFDYFAMKVNRGSGTNTQH
jgi:hypothetical protein